MIKKKLSIISPIYKGELMIHELVNRITLSIYNLVEDYEIILINDASPDNSWEVIKDLCNKDVHIKALNLSRNFGQHYAITAGLKYSKGEYIVVLDCDLQDRPEEIPNLLNALIKNDYDIVYAQRKDRKDSFIKKISSTIHYFILNLLSGGDFDKSVANFGIYRKNVIDEYNKMVDVSRSFPSLINYLGFNVGYLQVQHAKRSKGNSSYDFISLLKLSTDIIISGSNIPLQFSMFIGFFMSFLSICLALYNIIANLIGIVTLPGYTTTIFSIWFVAGIIQFNLGVLGLYIGKIFNQVKQRQLFIIKNKCNL